MQGKLPGWVVDNRASVRREAELYRNMTPEERGARMAAAVRASARLLAIREDRLAVLQHRDALPASTVQALARLQARARGGR